MPHAKQNATPDRWLDLQRGLLVLGKIFKFGLFPFAGAVPFSPWSRQSFAVRFRRTLEELGLTYLKLGQFLALRFDILPAEICRELNNLFENVSPMAPGQAQSIVEQELQAPMARLFASFSPLPIAAASIGQVHEAYLADGTRVAVKVQRAGIMRIFKADIRNLHKLTVLAQRLGLSGQLDAIGMVGQFEQWTLREMDFRSEGHTAERVRENAGPAVVIPEIHWSMSTARVLTMDFIEGMSASYLPKFLQTATPEEVQARLPGFDFATAMHNFTEASLSQLFTDGFFHGDPHPGNIMFLSDNRVVFLDFGIFGALDAQEREVVTGQIENLATGDIDASLRYYARQVMQTSETNFDQFRDDCRELLKRWYRALLDPELPIEERHLARFTGEMIDVARRNGLIYDLKYLLFWRAINNLNATLWHIQPNFDLLAELRRFFEKTRPRPAERIRAVVGDPAWQEAVMALSLYRPRIPVPPMVRASITASHQGERRLGRQGAAAGGFLLAVSVSVVAAAPALPDTLRWGLPGLLALITGRVLWQRR